MPVHDWTRVDAGIFHDFHTRWIVHLGGALNQGLLPADYYAVVEQHAARYVADVLTLRDVSKPPTLPTHERRGLAVAEVPPKVRHKLSLSASARSRRRTLALRHVSGDRLVAIIEIVSSANKDRRQSVREFVDKIENAVRHGVHVLLVDLFAPGRHDPRGLHGAIWRRLGDRPRKVPVTEPLMLASYVADRHVEAYLEYVAVGQALPEMPLFLEPDLYVNVPLESTYQTSWRETPERWRRVLEGREA